MGRKLSYEGAGRYGRGPSSNKGPTPDDASPSDDAGSTRRTPPTDEELGERSGRFGCCREYRARDPGAGRGGDVLAAAGPGARAVRSEVPDEGDAADVTDVTDAGGDEVAGGGGGDSPGGDSPVGGDGADVDRPGTPSPGEQRDEGPDDPTWQSPAVYRSLAARRRRVTGARRGFRRRRTGGRARVRTAVDDARGGMRPHGDVDGRRPVPNAESG